jgi:hypothetical protein
MRLIARRPWLSTCHRDLQSRSARSPEFFRRFSFLSSDLFDQFVAILTGHANVRNDAIEARFKKAWGRADVKLTSSRSRQ